MITHINLQRTLLFRANVEKISFLSHLCNSAKLLLLSLAVKEKYFCFFNFIKLALGWVYFEEATFLIIKLVS